MRVIALVAIGMFALGMVQKLPCYNGAWFFGASSQYTHACYSDIPHLYQGRGFADGLVPYFDRLPGDMEYLEYPVLTGVFMEVASWLTPGGGTIQHREQIYWMVNAGHADGLRGGHRRLRGPHPPPAPLGRPAGRPGARLRADRHHQLGPAGGRPDGRRRC